MRFLLIALLCALSYAQTDPATRKRGFSGFLGTYFTCKDAAALNLDDSWYYTWMTKPSQKDACKKDGYWGADQAKEFVPMVNGIYQAKRLLEDPGNIFEEWQKGNAHYLLGYNEPDSQPPGIHPHNCTPIAAARDWVNVQKLAVATNLTLVSPAPSTNDWDENGHSEWLDAFFEECQKTKDCDVDTIKHIGYHDYSGNVETLKGRVNGMYAKYGRPIWLTEFSIGRWAPPNGPTRGEQDAYMKEALEFLDSSPYVFRYAWFSSRTVPSSWGGTKNLLPYDSDGMALTSTGRIYAGMDD